MDDLIIKSEIFSILSQSPSYFVKKGYLRKTVIEDEEERSSLQITKKAFEDLKEVARRRLKRRKLQKQIKKSVNAIKKKNLKDINLFDFAQIA